MEPDSKFARVNPSLLAIILCRAKRENRSPRRQRQINRLHPTCFRADPRCLQKLRIAANLKRVFTM